MLPAAPSKVTWNCWKIATVKVSNRTIANAPNSASRWTPISRPPPRMASRSCGSTTRKNTPAESEPSARADSSTAGSSRRSVAATGRYMNGKYDSVATKHTRPQPVQRRDHPDPRVAVDERRDRKGRDEQRTPERPAGQIGPLHQPGDTDTDDHTQRHRHDDQGDGVEQQLADPGPDHEVVGLRPPDGHRGPCDVSERNQGGGDQDRDRGSDQRAGSRGLVRPRDRRRRARNRGSDHL